MMVFEVPSVAALAAATGATSAIAVARSVAFSALLVMDGKTPPGAKHWPHAEMARSRS